MKYFLLFLLILLTGCSITPIDYRMAEAYCKDNGGLESLRRDLAGEIFITCNNGAKFVKSRIKE